MVLFIGFAMIVSFIPALRLIVDSGAPQLGYTSSQSKPAKILLKGVVALQIGSCIVICIMTASIVRSIHSLSREALGFESEKLLVAPIIQDEHKSSTITANDSYDFPLAQLTREILETAPASLAENHRVAVAGCAPASNTMPTLSISVNGRDVDHQSAVFACGVTQGFFQTIGTSFVLGQTFSNSSLIGAPSEVIINQRLATRLWPTENPLHQRLRVQDPSTPAPYLVEVTGVIENLRFADLGSDAVDTIYLPLRGNIFLMGAPPLYALVHGSASDHDISDFLGGPVSRSTTGLGLGSVYSVDGKLQFERASESNRAYVAVFAAALVVVIAYLGLMGSLVQFINSRRREIAIRMCFGASRFHIQAKVLKEALQTAAIGAVVALIVGRLIAQVVASMWPVSTTWSWGIACTTATTCIAGTLMISLLPAVSASNLVPAVVIREQ
jgi:hypothetical protein